MQNTFSTYPPTDNGLAPHSQALSGSVNQSPEAWTSLEPSPHAGIREKVVPINSAVENAREVSSLQGKLKFALRQLSDVQVELKAMHLEIQAVKQAAYEQMLQFEKKHQQAAIQQSKIRLAQDQQLERRLQQFVQDTVKTAVHSAVERFMRVRNAAMPESARQPSTYSVPNRPNTGIYS